MRIVLGGCGKGTRRGTVIQRFPLAAIIIIRINITSIRSIIIASVSIVSTIAQ